MNRTEFVRFLRDFATAIEQGDYFSRKLGPGFVISDGQIGKFKAVIGEGAEVSVELFHSTLDETRNPDKYSRKEAIEFNHFTENLIEISMMYACMNPGTNIESTELKQHFIDWSNEFESVYDDSKDYLEQIESFAETKIKEYAK